MTKQTVELIDHMGSDLSVVNAARVSFDKESEWDNHLGFNNVLDDKDTSLIRYLAKHNHWTPFGHTAVTFRIKAPIFVARQLMKHTVGLVWNEVSRRYVDSEPEFFEPEVWRERAENVKQGSSDEAVPFGKSLHDQLLWSNQESLTSYEWLLKAGVAPEQARMVLPQSMMTTWMWTGNVASFARVCKLRLDPHSQRETQEVAKMISDEMAVLYPVSWKELMQK